MYMTSTDITSILYLDIENYDRGFWVLFIDKVDTFCMPCLNPITVYSYRFLFNCTTVGQASDSMRALM